MPTAPDRPPMRVDGIDVSFEDFTGHPDHAPPADAAQGVYLAKWYSDRLWHLDDIVGIEYYRQEWIGPVTMISTVRDGMGYIYTAKVELDFDPRDTLDPSDPAHANNAFAPRTPGPSTSAQPEACPTCGWQTRVWVEAAPGPSDWACKVCDLQAEIDLINESRRELAAKVAQGRTTRSEATRVIQRRPTDEG